mgnify:CR=1 FL=1
MVILLRSIYSREEKKSSITNMVNILIPDLITIVGAELVDAGAGEVPERSALIQDSSANYSKE